MKILAIETSCDETAISLLKCTGTGSFQILANELSSQAKIHAKYGGVYPMMAKREHIKNLPILFKKVLKKITPYRQRLWGKSPVDLVAVTSGPGLEPALWTGIVFAKEKAKEWGVPLMPVNHMEGHILSVFGKNKGEFKIPKVEFPILSLLVSGGHTELVLVKDWMKYEVIGETLDDAVGEAFDKVARMMDLPYPGGPEISKLAEEARNNISSKPFSFPRPMMYTKNFDFSFSGIKTAVLYLIRDLKKQHHDILQNVGMKMAIALEFENAVTETIIYKTKKAIEKYKIKTLIVAGGVSANKHLRREIKKQIKIKTLFPDKKLSTDNSIMIGMVAYMKYLKNKGHVPRPSSIKAEGNLRL